MLCLNVLEDVLERPLDDALVVFDRFGSPCLSVRHLLEVVQVEVLHVEDWALNRVGLAGSCLSVGEDGAVVALHAAVGDRLRDVIEDCGLINLLVAHEVKAELLGVEATLQEDGPLVNLDTFRSALLRVLLPLVEWSNTNTHFDIVFLILLVLE